MRGIVISVHNLGATVRLEDGRLLAIPLGDVQAQRNRLTSSLRRREPLEFEVASAPGGHAIARLSGTERPPAEAPAPAETRAARTPVRHPEAPPEREEPVAPSGVPDIDAPAGFEAAMSAYLKSLEEREGSDGASAAERHALRKKKRAAWFEARRGPA